MAMDSNPLARALNAQLHAVDATNGHVKLSFEPDPLFIQGTGVLQGGAVSAMLDFAMAIAVLAHVKVGYSCATVNMNTSFLRPAPHGRYRAIGALERSGKSIAFARASLAPWDAATRVVASASSTLVLAVKSPSI